MTKRSTPFSPEVRERAVRMVLDHQGEHGCQTALNVGSSALSVLTGGLRR